MANEHGHSADDGMMKHAEPASWQVPVSRRTFLGAAAASAAAGGASLAASRRARRKQESQVVEKVVDDALQNGGGAFDPDLVLLINRITGGFSLAEYAHAEAIGGYEAYLDEQLIQYESLTGSVNDPELWTRLADFDIYDMSGTEMYEEYGLTNMTFEAQARVTGIQVILPIYAKAQLQMRMLQFWRHHFNVEISPDYAQRWVLWPFMRDVALNQGLGNVPDIVRGSAHSASMLRYLNNYTNVAGNVDENYARELMELHTLGVNQGYNEQDVQEVARILTGWSACFDNGCNDGPFTYQYGEYWFRSDKHDTGDKMVMGQFIPGRSGSAGQEEGEELITFLTQHENCAKFIATKLCRYFLGGNSYNYDPPEDIVQFVKWTYLNNPVAVGDVRSMLAIILHRDVLTQYARPKFRRPFDLVTGAIRAIGADVNPLAVSTTRPLIYLLTDLLYMGMQPHFWPAPNGPSDSRVWTEGGIAGQWNFVDKLAHNNCAEVVDFSLGPGGLLDQIGATAPGTQAQGFNIMLTGGRMSTKEVKAVQDFIGYGNPNTPVLHDALAFAMQMPTFQYI